MEELELADDVCVCAHFVKAFAYANRLTKKTTMHGTYLILSLSSECSFRTWLQYRNNTIVPDLDQRCWVVAALGCKKYRRGAVSRMMPKLSSTISFISNNSQTMSTRTWSTQLTQNHPSPPSCFVLYNFPSLASSSNTVGTIDEMSFSWKASYCIVEHNRIQY